jgi:hypothetical protein
MKPMKFENVTTALLPLEAQHHRRHVLNTLPHAREAMVFMLCLPEHGLAGFVYPWVNGAGSASAAVCIFGAAVDEPIQERFEEVAVPAQMDFDDWSVRGLTMRSEQPDRRIQVVFKGQRVNVSYDFEALHPMYAFSSSKGGCPPYFSDDRTEQHGRVHGVLEIDGKSYPFDTFGQRDHSWGQRIWGVNQHYKWFHATTQSAAIHFFQMQSFGKVHLMGYVVRDGRMAQIESVDLDYQFNDNMHHRAIVATAHDAEGRTTVARCNGFAFYTYQADPLIVLNETATQVEIDGEVGVGWCEFCWNRNYLEFARQHVAYHR